MKKKLQRIQHPNKEFCQGYELTCLLKITGFIQYPAMTIWESFSFKRDTEIWKKCNLPESTEVLMV